MSDMVRAHPLVRVFLHDLNAACAMLPRQAARELREQLVAHLEDALPRGASDEAVRDELGRLGAPAALAAEAVASARLSPARKLRARLSRVRWWMWAAIGLLLPALGVGAGFLISMNSVAPLTSSGAGWLYPVDQDRAVNTTADDVTQTTIPIRSGQRQGIELLLLNDSDWTQVILGPGDHWQPLSAEPIQVTVETGSDLDQLGTVLSGGSSYVPAGAIPPHTARWVHVTWLSDLCMGANTGVIIDWIPLRVRVGLLTKTEVITPPFLAFAVNGTSRGKCG